jgi:hypothetical protein
VPKLMRILCLGLVLIGGAFAAEAGGTAGADDTPDVQPYPLAFCTTCGDDLSTEAGKADTVAKVHKGREIKLCKGCVKIFTADPDGYLRLVDKAIKDGKPTRSGHGKPKE